MEEGGDVREEKKKAEAATSVAPRPAWEGPIQRRVRRRGCPAGTWLPRTAGWRLRSRASPRPRTAPPSLWSPRQGQGSAWKYTNVSKLKDSNKSGIKSVVM